MEKERFITERKIYAEGDCKWTLDSYVYVSLKHLDNIYCSPCVFVPNFPPRSLFVISVYHFVYVQLKRKLVYRNCILGHYDRKIIH